MHAGDLFFQQRDTEKALENWVRVTNLNPEHVPAFLSGNRLRRIVRLRILEIER
jgi:lipopolysaccharide biosynthesis regulator YciM